MTISILCGGSGTRLFPLSRELMPKQFASLLPQSTNSQTKSLFQETLLRNIDALRSLDSLDSASIQVITNESLYFLAKDQAKEINIHIDSFICESYGKNTAPALAFSALYASKYATNKENEIILALPSDHLINSHHYKECLEQAFALAMQDKIVTFGIVPTFAHTGYGYIKTDKLDSTRVLGFYEKPTIQKAREFLAEGNYYWNSGMFCFKASALLDELQTHAKSIYQMCKKVFQVSALEKSESSENLNNHKQNKNCKNQCLRLDRALRYELEDKSIDYALMEKTKNIACIVSDLKWSDVGSFEYLSQEYPKDIDNNASNTHFISKDSHNNFVLSNRPVIGIGINDLIVVDGGDCLLVSKKGESSRIKEILPKLKTLNPEILKTHATTHRPWGSYTVLLEGESYKIKQIIVKPKSRLSLQKHFHRNEHWIIVNGSALVTINGKETFLKANQSTYIPMGQTNRLENPGIIPLVMIEVQVGEYLGEDDIVRLEDDYLRVK